MRLLLEICLAALILLNGNRVRSSEGQNTSVSIWHLDQTTQVGEYVATVLGAPKVVTEQDGKAIYFNGSTDGIFLPVNPLAGMAEFSVEVLYKPEAGGPAEQRFLHVQDKVGSRALMEIRLEENAWALDTFLYSLKTESKCPLLDRTKLHPADRWTWVALVYANGHMTHYINGVKELEGDVAFPPMEAGQISLGVRQNKVFWFKGGLREIRFHAVALSQEKLQRTESK